MSNFVELTGICDSKVAVNKNEVVDFREQPVMGKSCTILQYKNGKKLIVQEDFNTVLNIFNNKSSLKEIFATTDEVNLSSECDTTTTINDFALQNSYGKENVWIEPDVDTSIQDYIDFKTNNSSKEEIIIPF